MRVSLALTGTIALLIAGCSAAPRDDEPATTSNAAADSRLETFDVAEPAMVAPDPLAARQAGSPPAVNPDAAPGVAFGYSYNFGLAADRIAPVQQAHARLCEELGIARCRVTGLSYSGSDDDVRAELKLVVAADLAHRFGERALDRVREAEGRLIDSRVAGEDVSEDLRSDTRSLAALEAELRTLGSGPGSASRADALRDRIDTLRRERDRTEDRVTRTPLTFSYRSGAFATGTPDFGGVIASAWGQTKWLAYGLFTLAMALAPWAAIVLLGWLGVRALRRRRAARA